MIIDVHGHLSAPPALWTYLLRLLRESGAAGRRRMQVSDDELRDAALVGPEGRPGHIECMRRNGIDLQLISAPQTSTMNSEPITELVHWLAEETNNLVHRTVELFPEHFLGICTLPQAGGEPIERVLPELERCVGLGFRGCSITPDPYENRGPKVPPMGDRYWYGLYEKLCEYDIPGYIHAGASRTSRMGFQVHASNEETVAVFSLAMSSVFDDFPDLKLIVAHGGGAVPYQFARYDAWHRRVFPGSAGLRAALRNIYYDTMLFSPGALALLFDVVGADRVVLGTECPGVGTITNPATGRAYDDMLPTLREMKFLDDTALLQVTETTARHLFKIHDRM